jgi:MSHA biogenesis protein MshE
VSNAPRKRIRLGELLVEQKLLTAEQLLTALDEQKRSGRKLGRVLTELGLVREEKLHEVLAKHLQIPFIDVRQLTLDQQTVRLLPEAQARRFRALVLQSDARGLLIGMTDPTDLMAYDELSARLKQPLRIALVKEADLLKTMDVVYRRTDEIASAPPTCTSSRARTRCAFASASTAFCRSRRSTAGALPARSSRA